jgi:hypothetical protein
MLRPDIEVKVYRLILTSQAYIPRKTGAPITGLLVRKRILK